MGKDRDIKVVVSTALEKKISVDAKKEYEAVLKEAGCETDTDVRIMTTTFLTNGLFKARVNSEKPIHDLLPLLNHAESKNIWLNNIKNKIIPRLK